MNIARRVRKYIDSHIIIKKSLSDNIVNYSSLARKIQREKGIDNFDAVLISIRRYANYLQKKVFLKNVKQVLDESNIVFTKDCVDLTISTKNYSEGLRDFCDIVLIGDKDTALITHEKNLSKITSLLKNKIKMIRSGLVLVSIKTSNVEDVPNFMFYLLSLTKGMNIIEFASFSDETVFLIDSKYFDDFKNIFNK